MSLDQKKNLLKFLKPFPAEVQDKALFLRAFVWNLYPLANELIYDNYNALAFGWSPTDRVGHTFCSIAVGRTSHNVHFGFYWGSRISDPKKMLIGEGNQYRYILVHQVEDFPETYIRKLLKEAYAYSLTLIKVPQGKQNTKTKPSNAQGLTIVKSVSAAKKRKRRKRNLRLPKDIEVFLQRIKRYLRQNHF